MSFIALLTFIVITFALMVGSAIGMICGEMFGSKFSIDDNKMGGWSWLGGAMDALVKFTGGDGLDDIAAIPQPQPHQLQSSLQPPTNKVNDCINSLANDLFDLQNATPHDIKWEDIDTDNIDSETMNKLYKLYYQEHEHLLQNSSKEAQHKELGGSSDKVKNILKALTDAGVGVNNVNNVNNDQSVYVSDPVVYADIGAGDCNTTLEIAKGVSAAKIYNIDVANYCPDVAVINYVDGSIDKIINIPSSSINIVTMINSLHHMNDSKHKIEEVKRILVPGGILLIYDHCVSNNEVKQIVKLQHILYYISNLTQSDVILEYNEFKKSLTDYLTYNQLYLFDRDKLDKMLLGSDNSNNQPKLTMLNFENISNNYNTFIATYKKIE
nr:putative methyltransferase [Faustovirus mariensis]